MTGVLLTVAVILLVAGIIFSILPPLPGPVISFSGLVVTHFASADTSISAFWLIVLGVGMIAVTIFDYIMPAIATKKSGGTKAGVWGGLIGTLVGVISPIPFGLIWGPLLGAIIGDLIGGNQIHAAMKSGLASFLGFVVATLMKVTYSVVVGIVILWEIGGQLIEFLGGWFA